MGEWVFEITEHKSEARSDLRGHLEAVMASEATKIAVRGNMHIDTREIKVADLTRGQIGPLRLFGCRQGL